MKRVQKPSSSSNPKSTELEEALDTAQRAVDRVVRLQSGAHASFEEVERLTLEVTNKVGRLQLERRLQRLADRLPKVFRFNTFRYQQHGTGTVTYHSLCGPLRIRRWTYRRTGVRNGPTMVPLDTTAGILEQATPAFSYCVAKGYAKTTMRDLVEDLEAAHRCPPSRSCLEEMAKALGSGVHDSLDELEPQVRMQEELPQGACAIAVGLDRTSIPMEEEREADKPPNSRRKCRKKPYERKPPKPVDVHYRMAYVGTVAITDANGETLFARRYAVPAHEGTDDLMPRVMADVHNALLQDPELHVGVIQDGAAELWGLMWDAMRDEPLVKKYYQGIDRYHLNEHLAAALLCIEADAAQRKRKLHLWNEQLDKSDSAIDAIERELTAAMSRSSPAKRKQIYPHQDYVFGFSDRMRYATMKKLGLPVGSGVTEGACKSVINARTKRSGQRWSQDGVSAVLSLRTLHQSERLDAYWPLFSRWKTCADLIM